jgi:hypothetical protein
MITNDLLTEKNVQAAPPRAEDIGGPISLERAVKWTKAYRESHPNQIRAHFFGINIIKRILSQEKCAGIRIYYAIDNEVKMSSRDRLLNRIINFLQKLKSNQMEAKQLILAGADENVIDQIPGQNSSESFDKKLNIDHLLSTKRVELNDNGEQPNTNYILADMSAVCPNMCSPISPLDPTE